MGKIAVYSCLLLASAAVTTAATAKHSRHRMHVVRYHVLPTESLTTVGTPDCHVQGRLLRTAHHCPPQTISAAPW
ncbi:MAG: hypothetical protein P4M07_28335 [Xanthobacteraceae bacterium]|nr:hypothetical protein [Xanthobacteraceae bacterium]